MTNKHSSGEGSLYQALALARDFDSIHFHPDLEGNVPLNIAYVPGVLNFYVGDKVTSIGESDSVITIQGSSRVNTVNWIFFPLASASPRRFPLKFLNDLNLSTVESATIGNNLPLHLSGSVQAAGSTLQVDVGSRLILGCEFKIDWSFPRSLISFGGFFTSMEFKSNPQEKISLFNSNLPSLGSTFTPVIHMGKHSVEFEKIEGHFKLMGAY
ncbi:MAG: hypothetical protein S4CHLAM102_13840 [Chlamydiia bacterium]|nr:hypothetical protein [Chlamydiia bacterium]